MGFKEDSERGGRVEGALLKRLKQAFPASERVFGNHPEYDIKIPEINKTVEVKYDPKSQETGNVVIEYFHRKPSALSVSEADYWMFDLGDREIWIERAGILDCILSAGLEPVRITGAADRYAKWVFLVPRELLIRYSTERLLGRV